ncbi:polysaccharide biosynthesis protein [Flavobacterium aurantiibacter]|uniref:Polysaccharide biosynthesis protein n=1 Tax=Flavobacterium aurantiibacter TaxID=2023067 RepID=A0A255ZR16_9FLAO|nr:nucleoside-diphosphate sugar epimerase/dehydratase [Flavobacterium aurantiibacter]OYQ43938.1 polysaccharide biosynthesis protein [Flavobacterium aurantiibacter]
MRFFDDFTIGKTLKDLSYLPRWIVLLIDMFIVFCCALFTFLMLTEMERNYVHGKYLEVIVPYFLLVNLFFFYVLRTYSGIIRHSSFIDAVKLFLSLFLTLVVLVITNGLCDLIIGQKIFMNAGLFINFIFTFCGLLLYRIIVRQTFEVYLSEIKEEELIRVLIFGADANAISVANALKLEKPVRFKVIGFVDKDYQSGTKRILNLPILSYSKKISALMRNLDAEGLIIADKSLTKEESLSIVEDCLEYNLKVYSVPIITDWENKKEISKKIQNYSIQDLLERKPIVLDMQSISQQLDGKIVLITGAAGSIGSEIARQISKFNPKKLVLLDQAESPLHNLTLELPALNTDIDYIPILADVRDRESLRLVFEQHQPQVVYHAAAYKHVPLMEANPVQAVKVNVLGTKNIADLAVDFKVERVVMVSTDKAVNPSNVMGASKRIAEIYVQSFFKSFNFNKNVFATKFITTRFGNVLGSNGSVVPLFTNQIKSGGPVTITHPDIIRYFMTIPEACQLVLEAGSMGKGGEIFIFDMGKPVKIIDLARKMIRLAGLKPDEDIEIKIIGLRPGEKLYEELLNDQAKTLPTHHSKIMIATEESENFYLVENQINDLVWAIETGSNNSIVSKMKEIVPEFKSLNSHFSRLD